MTLMVGAPVHQRAWILDEWFEALANQEDFDPKDIEIVLNYGAGSDTTLSCIRQEQMRARFRRVKILEDPHTDHVGHREWTLDRYATMTRLRNDLLAYVRQENPDFYLSCDTDMLLPPHTLRTLFENFKKWDGIAPLTFMTTNGEQFPNCTALDGRRYVPDATSQQHAVFGTVLMNQALYQVDYAPHHMGEDFGWADNARKMGMTMAICPEIRIKHVMQPDLLGTLDVRIGF